MREPLFTPGNAWLRDTVDPNKPESLIAAQDRAALHRAIGLSIESAFTYGVDLPVGAVALQSGEIIGRGFANDTRFGFRRLHAEKMAMLDASLELWGGEPDTMVVTLEPCGTCQLELVRANSIKRVLFGVARAEIVEMGLVNPARHSILDKASELPYEVAQADDEQLHSAALTVLRHVQRDPSTGIVSVDGQALNTALVALNEA